MYKKIAIIGDRGSVLGFMSLGFDVHEVQKGEGECEVEEAAKILHKLAKSDEYAVIFITEELAAVLEEETAKYKDAPLPAIISIPGQSGSTGYGMKNIRSAVERAVGADILFKE